MSAAEAKRKRTTLRLLLAGTAALCLPAWMAPELIYGENVMSSTDELQQDAEIRRFLMEKIDLTSTDYAELDMPEWMLRAEEKQDVREMEAAMDAALSNSDSNEISLAPYGFEEIVQASALFANTIAILVYDPEMDEFVFVYNKGKQRWVSGCAKLTASFKNLSFMLRQTFPERFQGTESQELAIAIGSGDYPHLQQECIDDFPHATASCPQQDAPIMQFGSIFRHAEIFPNMIAMPMPEGHNLPCFKGWAFDSVNLCRELRPGPEDKGRLVFGEEYGLTWENLTPQVVWRGTDFGYLNHIERNLWAGQPARDIENTVDPTDVDTDKKILGTSAMREAYDHLMPRWQGVVLTAEAEREAEEKSADLPWANIKFTGGSQGTDAETEMYAQFAGYGIPAIGEHMLLEDFAEYKYQLDLGGGGGTTWGGTITKLALPGLLFHHETPTKDYIHDQVKPWIHYVPVAPDLRDLKEKYDWAESHPETAKMIADRGSAFMRQLGTVEGFGSMYEEVFVEPVRKVIEAYQPVSTTHPGSSWREVLKKLGGDGYMQVWRCTGESPRLESTSHRMDTKL